MKREQMEFTGQSALDELARQWALHDGTLRALSVVAVTGTHVAVEMECVPRPESPVSLATIRLRGVNRLDFLWSGADNEFFLISAYKALTGETGNVYLSLDPFDEGVARPDERDCFVFEAESIVVSLDMKAATLQR